jgi:hypothetical protein
MTDHRELFGAIIVKAITFPMGSDSEAAGESA